MSGNRTINGVSALEMTMRDVLDGLEDFAAEFSFHSTPDVFEILAIEPPDDPIDAAPLPHYQEPELDWNLSLLDALRRQVA